MSCAGVCGRIKSQLKSVYVRVLVGKNMNLDFKVFINPLGVRGIRVIEEWTDMFNTILQAYLGQYGRLELGT